MVGEIVCGHCPLANGCRYRFHGLGAARIALAALYRRDLGPLLAVRSMLSVDDVRDAVDRYIRCPDHGGGEPPAPSRPAWPQVA